MKTLLIYYSKTGFTKRYATWLSEEIDCDLQPFDPSLRINKDSYDTIIFASWLHAGSIQKLDWLKKQDLSSLRKIIMVTGASPESHSAVEQDLRKHFPEQSPTLRAFYLPAGLSYENMGFIDKGMMKAFSSILNKKKNKTPMEETMCRSIQSSFDHCSREYLKPVIEYLRSGQ